MTSSRPSFRSVDEAFFWYLNESEEYAEMAAKFARVAREHRATARGVAVQNSRYDLLKHLRGDEQ